MLHRGCSAALGRIGVRRRQRNGVLDAFSSSGSLPPRHALSTVASVYQHVRRNEVREELPGLGSCIEIVFGRGSSVLLGRVVAISPQGKSISIIPLSSNTQRAAGSRSPRFTEMDVLNTSGRSVSHIFGVSLHDGLMRKSFLEAAQGLFTSLSSHSATALLSILQSQFHQLPFTAEDMYTVVASHPDLSVLLRDPQSTPASSTQILHHAAVYACQLWLRHNWTLVEPGDSKFFTLRSPAAAELALNIHNALMDDDKLATFVAALRQLSTAAATSPSTTNMLETLNEHLLTAVELFALSASSARCRLPIELVDRISRGILTGLGLGSDHSAASVLLLNIGRWSPDTSPTMHKGTMPSAFRRIESASSDSPSLVQKAASSTQSQLKHGTYAFNDSARIIESAEGNAVALDLLDKSVSKGLFSGSIRDSILSSLSSATGVPGVVMPLLDQSTGQMRKDLGDLQAFAIDDASTTEVDDAISIDGSDIYVHIADPTALIAPHSSLDLLGRERVETVYMPDQKITMLPEILATSSLSLREGLKVPALTFKITLTSSGAIGQFSIFPSFLNKLKRVTYDQVERLLATEPVDSESVALHQIWNAAQLRRSYRQSIGARLINLPQVGVRVSDPSHPEESPISLDVSQQAQVKSRRLVEEFMVVTGEIAGNFSAAERIPVPYRVQRPPTDVDPWKPPQGLDQNLVTIVQLLREISGFFRADTTVVGAPHHSLSFERYARCSSPIRRYSDMIVHHQLKAYLSRGRNALPFDTALLNVLATHMDAKSKQIRFIQRYAEAYWKMQHVIRSGIGRTWRAVVIDTPDVTVSDPTSAATGVRMYQVYILDLSASFRVYPPRHLPGSIAPGTVVHVTAARRSAIDAVFEITSVETSISVTELLSAA
jgi:hypothetical protein